MMTIVYLHFNYLTNTICNFTTCWRHPYSLNASSNAFLYTQAHRLLMTSSVTALSSCSLWWLDIFRCFHAMTTRTQSDIFSFAVLLKNANLRLKFGTLFMIDWQSRMLGCSGQFWIWRCSEVFQPEIYSDLSNTYPWSMRIIRVLMQP